MSLLSKRYKDLFELVPTAFGNRGQVISTNNEPEDPASLKQMQEIIIRWCVTNQFFITTASGDRYVPNLASASIDCKLRHYIYELNLKRLCVSERFNDALMIFADTDYDKTMSRLIDLHLQIITEVDAGFVNLYINKLVHGLTALYEADKDTDLSWREILTDYPYFWVLFPIQWIMRNTNPVLLG